MNSELEVNPAGDVGMKKWRRESVLDLYNFLLAMFLCISPGFFAHANQTPAIDLRL
jgi:hypothetical protein